MLSKKSFYLVSLLLLSTTVYAQKVKLSYQFNKDDVFALEEEMDQTISQDIMGQQVVIIQKITTAYDFKIVNVDDERNYEASVTYKYVAVDMDQAGQKISYDSREDSEPDMSSKTFAALVGSSFALIFTPTGEVLSVSGVEDLLQKMVGVYDNLSDVQREQVLTTIKQQYGSERIRFAMESLLEIYPDSKKKTKKGAAWEKKRLTSIGGMMSLNLVIEHTFTKNETETALITVKNEINTNPEDVMKVNGMDMKFGLTGTGSGEVKVAKENGRILAKEMSVNISGKVTLVKGNEAMEGQSWDMVIETIGKVREI
ncbi:MAG: DUF6263 family protein [Bacteroidota bacterium]